MKNNLILLTDSYKISHSRQYPKGTSNVYSYFESRGGKWNDVVFFGLQYILKEYLSQRVTREDITEASKLLDLHFGHDQLNHSGWNHIVDDHDGYLPLSIRAVPEGSVNPTRSVLMTVENTCPRCYWLTNYVETLLVQSWYPTTVATASREVKRIILKYLERTGDPALIDFKLHDFGFRGVSSCESAAIGGTAHLVNFRGTDTLVALQIAAKHYGEECAGFSIPASEHSTMTSWGQENEVAAYRNFLEIYPKDMMIACVSDSYDIMNACNNIWGGELKGEVLSRNAPLVVRPDSGYPPHVVRDVVDALYKTLGGKYNSKGFKVLNPKVRVIQGDGVTPDTIEEILHQLQFWEYSADNVAFGMGGGLLQKLDRDTQKFAFKCSSVIVDGVQRDVFKNPKTDPGKVSKAGRFDNLNLPEVFRDGKVLINQSLAEIRDRAKLG